MRLTITSSDVQNTNFIAGDGQIWYTVETPWKMGNRTTTFTRNKPKPEKIGEFIRVWQSWKEDRVQIGATTLDSGDFLRCKGLLSNHLFMTGTDGTEYEWKAVGPEYPEYELWSLASGRCVAHHRAGNYFKDRKPALIIEPEGEPIMDVIIIAFTIIEYSSGERHSRH